MSKTYIVTAEIELEVLDCENEEGAIAHYPPLFLLLLYNLLLQLENQSRNQVDLLSILHEQ